MLAFCISVAGRVAADIKRLESPAASAYAWRTFLSLAIPS